MSQILQVLGKDLQPDTRRRLSKRSNTLMRGIRFLEQREEQNLPFVNKAGWTMERLEVVCDLAAFHQIVIGPLASSAHNAGDSGLGSSIGIAYGAEMRFDRRSAREFAAMNKTFLDMARRHGISQWWLVANDANDLIYRIAQSYREE